MAAAQLTDQANKDIFLGSLERCLADDSFIPTFYKLLLASSVEVQEKFKHTSFKEQNKKLVRSLRLVAGAAQGGPEALAELRERSETHDRYHLNINPELYTFWLDAIINTAREFDNEWSDEVELAWVSILGFAIHYMLKRY